MPNLFFNALNGVVSDAEKRMTAHGIPAATEQFRARGNHRVADNDEPEPEDLRALGAALAPQVRHVIRRESTGTGISDSTTSVCACGWRGRPEYQHNDYMFSNLLDQERAHMANPARSGNK